MELVARAAADGATCEWPSREEGEFDLNAEPTRQSKTTLHSLAPNLVYEACVRSVTKRGRSDVGEPASFRVP
jgi:hypothetical protein